MASNRNIRFARHPQPQRFVKEAYLVICEGETEQTYVDMLRRMYHSPIKIVSHVVGQRVSQRLIDRYVAQLRLDKADKISVFLMYDMDVAEVNNRFEQCKATLLLSNPCVELWLLLHLEKPISPLSSDECIRLLRKTDPHFRVYAKGTLSDSQQKLLWLNRNTALLNAKCLKDMSNPSSCVYKLIERLEAANQLSMTAN